MPEPLVVIIPHRLGKTEALRRIKSGIERARPDMSSVLTVEEERWEGDRLGFAVRALGQRASGAIDVYDANVRLEVVLPWLLHKFAAAVQRVIGQRGQLLLEKK